MINDGLTINSTLLYAIAFAVTFFIHELGLVLAGSVAGLEPILYHNTMSYTAVTNKSQLIAFGAGPLSVLISGLIALLLYYFLREKKNLLKLFFIWLYIQGLTLFLSQIPAAPFAPESDMAKAFNALELSNTFMIILAAISIVLLILLGSLSAKPFLSLATDNELIDSVKKRRIFILWIAIIPWLAGGFICFPFRVPPATVNYLFLPIIVGVVVVWSYVNAFNVKLHIKINNSISQNFSVSLFVIYVVMLVVYQLVLREGIKFY